MRPVDRKNLEFIRWTLDNEGEVALKSWYDSQEPHVQKYILSLLELNIQEIRDISSNLSVNLQEARSVLSQFMSVKNSLDTPVNEVNMEHDTAIFQLQSEAEARGWNIFDLLNDIRKNGFLNYSEKTIMAFKVFEAEKLKLSPAFI